ncbi:hypothetical protein [Nonomuraea sp. NPDC050783]|uniref:hypothetical protein n=1 Tax=Nonomuraea sp. NPDC050783 TaxID=3154634 RepID=UPI003464EA5A
MSDAEHPSEPAARHGAHAAHPPPGRPWRLLAKPMEWFLLAVIVFHLARRTLARRERRPGRGRR